MLKRHQFLIEDWQEDYLKFISKTYDISYSEALRILFCIAAMQCVKEIHPQYKPTSLTIKKVVQAGIKIKQGKIREEDFHGLISQVYFDARKAIEYRASKVAKQNKNK
ncbi:hypothetical protein ACFL3J_01640 [Candidatus Omnitrophota bacterium]